MSSRWTWFVVVVVPWLEGCGAPGLPMDAVDVSSERGTNTPKASLGGSSIDDINKTSKEEAASLCLEGGSERSVVPPEPGDLLIVEVLANPEGPDLFGDWFEVYVLGDSPFDLNGLSIINTDEDGIERAHTIEAAACLSVWPGQYVVVGALEDQDRNGGVPVDVEVELMRLFNTEGYLEIVHEDTVVDRARLPEPTPGVSATLPPPYPNAAINDEATRFCDSSMEGLFDGFGSPGSANEFCP